MVAGFDKRGPSIYYVDNDGSRLEQRVCSVGSGSLNAYGILDTQYKSKMTDEEALALGRRAIMHATYRDAGSGGQCTGTQVFEYERHWEELHFSSFSCAYYAWREGSP